MTAPENIYENKLKRINDDLKSVQEENMILQSNIKKKEEEVNVLLNKITYLETYNARLSNTLRQYIKTN